MGFLKEGCAQRGVSYSEDELVQVVDALGGIPGWLTLFGYHYAATRDLNKAIRVTRSEALKIVKEELESTARLASGRQRQLKILKAISEKSMKFNEIARELNLTDKALSRNLGMLQRLQYIENDEEKNYIVIDPIVKAFMKA